MSWKTITAFATDMTLDRAALDAAMVLARQEDAHLEVFGLGIDPTQPETWYTGTAAIALPGAMEEAARHAQELETAARALLEGGDLRWSVTAVATPMVGVQVTVADAARFSDLVVAAQPYGKGRGNAQVQVVEAALFGAGVPVLVVPDQSAGKSSIGKGFDRIAVAWNDSPEALRATREALPVLARASQVEIVVVDPPRHGPDRSDPGGRLAQMLARHGIRADIRILARTMPQISDVLARQVEDSGADLLVMGAYGHSRLREAILGGATRNTLEKSKVPVLMIK
jgi:nucleotide-binding universal stress UspA family protein